MSQRSRNCLELEILSESKNEKSCIVKTGINGGVDIYFGNSDYGYIPTFGEVITIEYISSSGFSGNIQESSSSVILEFQDSATDSFGGELDLNEIFDISVSKKIIMGADAEENGFYEELALLTDSEIVQKIIEVARYYQDECNN